MEKKAEWRETASSGQFPSVPCLLSLNALSAYEEEEDTEEWKRAGGIRRRE